MRRERLTGSPVTRGQNAVKHIDTASYSFDQVRRCANTHQVSRRIPRHSRGDVIDNVEHHRLLFPDAQSADCITVKTDLDRLFETLTPQIEVTRALNNAKQCLLPAQAFDFKTTGVRAVTLKAIKGVSGAFCPACGEVHAALRVFVSCFAGSTFVENHHDVRSECGLHFHRHLWR